MDLKQIWHKEAAQVEQPADLLGWLLLSPWLGSCVTFANANSRKSCYTQPKKVLTLIQSYLFAWSVKFQIFFLNIFVRKQKKTKK